MAAVPELSEPTRRLHGLRWLKLIDERGFAGGHLTWRNDPKRRQAASEVARRERPHFPFTLMPPPATDLGSTPALDRAGREWHEKRREEALAEWRAGALGRQEAAIEAIEIPQTVELAVARFEEIAPDYFKALATPHVSLNEAQEGIEAICASGGR